MGTHSQEKKKVGAGKVFLRILLVKRTYQFCTSQIFPLIIMKMTV